MPENWQRAGFGIYIHWPFCAAKCPYCDFNSHVVASVDQDAWKNAYVTEINRYADEMPDRVVSSIFFGGGTPSLMDPQTVAAILDTIGQRWTLSNNVEITLEANPTSIEAAKFQGYRSAGVNRVSIGVQALNDPDLKALGRLHSVDEALGAIQIARDTFDNTSFDLIYARQNQTLEAWEKELKQALDMAPSHLSLYQLTIEEGTAFGDRHKRGMLKGLPTEDLGADMYFTTQQMCEDAGLPAYEVSNHAKYGHESRHNMIYWTGGDYIGIGPGAHGRLTIENQRFATETALMPNVWLNSVKTSTAETLRERISDPDADQEYLLMGLRIRSGIDLDLIDQNQLNHNKIKSLQDAGVLALENNRLKVTDSGRPLLNHILQEILSP